MAIDKIDNKIIDEMNEIPNKYKETKNIIPEDDGDVILLKVEGNGRTYSITKNDLRRILSAL